MCVCARACACVREREREEKGWLASRHDLPFGERGLCRDFELVAVSLDFNLIAEVTGLAVNLHTLEHERLKVGHVEDFIVCRSRAVDGELFDFFLFGWWHVGFRAGVSYDTRLIGKGK